MKYYNEMKLEILYNEANIEFAKRAVVDFISTLSPSKEEQEVVATMLTEVVEDFKVVYGEKEERIIIKMVVDGDEVDIKAEQYKIQL